MLGNTNFKCDANMEIKRTTTFYSISVECKSNFTLDIFSNQSIIWPLHKNYTILTASLWFQFLIVGSYWVGQKMHLQTTITNFRFYSCAPPTQTAVTSISRWELWMPPGALSYKQCFSNTAHFFMKNKPLCSLPERTFRYYLLLFSWRAEKYFTSVQTKVRSDHDPSYTRVRVLMAPAVSTVRLHMG